jgi:hypothetical protein
MSKKIEHHQSKSLWNYTLSPGWKAEEVQVLRLALMKFGIGKWKRIVESKCLPGKSIGQIYMQTQRLVGQQSLGEFMGLHVRLEDVFGDNMKRVDVVRKNNFIVNTNDNPNKDERKRRIEENKLKYGLKPDEISDIRLPKWRTQGFLTLEEIETDKLSTL